MKFKYRLILLGNNTYTFEYKPQGFMGHFSPWKKHWQYYETEENAIEMMNHYIKEHNNDHNRKFKKVIKIVENK